MLELLLPALMDSENVLTLLFGLGGYCSYLLLKNKNKLIGNHIHHLDLAVRETKNAVNEVRGDVRDLRNIVTHNMAKAINDRQRSKKSSPRAKQSRKRNNRRD